MDSWKVGRLEGWKLNNLPAFQPAILSGSNFRGVRHAHVRRCSHVGVLAPQIWIYCFFHFNS